MCRCTGLIESWIGLLTAYPTLSQSRVNHFPGKVTRTTGLYALCMAWLCLTVQLNAKNMLITNIKIYTLISSIINYFGLIKIDELAVIYGHS